MKPRNNKLKWLSRVKHWKVYEGFFVRPNRKRKNPIYCMLLPVLITSISCYLQRHPYIQLSQYFYKVRHVRVFLVFFRTRKSNEKGILFYNIQELTYILSLDFWRKCTTGFALIKNSETENKIWSLHVVPCTLYTVQLIQNKNGPALFLTVHKGGSVLLLFCVRCAQAVPGY